MQLPTSAAALATLDDATWRAAIEGDPVQGRAWMAAAAQLGSARAQVILGQWLLDAHGGPREARQALQWFLKAAAQKHPIGLNMAGRCLENGWGEAVDLPRATALFKQAAELGLDAGMYNYANQLATGAAVPQDHRKALGWYSQAASLGHAKSMTKAGRYFEDGVVVPQDLALAFQSYQRAAEGGDFRGQFCYAGMLAARGDTDEALQWLRKVPETATPRYMAQAGQLLAQSPSEAIRAIGRDMLARAEAAGVAV